MVDDYLVLLNEGGQTYEFLLNGGPINNPATAAEFFLTLGYISAAWARLEQHIDSILLQVNKQQHSSEIVSLYDPNHPRPFTDKIRLLKRYFNQHPALKQHKSKIREFAAAVKKMATDRNIYLHSVLQGYDNKTKIVTLRSIQPVHNPENPYLFRIGKFAPPLRVMREFAEFVNRANTHLEEISRELFTHEAVARLREKPSPPTGRC